MKNRLIFFFGVFCACTMELIKSMESEIDLRLLATVNTLSKHHEFDRAHELIYKWMIAESIDEKTWQRLEKLILKKEYSDDQLSCAKDPLDTTALQFPFDVSSDVDKTATSSAEKAGMSPMPFLHLESLPTETDFSDDLEERTVHRTMVIPLAIQKKAYALLLDDQIEEAETLLALNDIDEKTIAQFITNSRK